MKALTWVAALAFVLSGCLGVNPKLDTDGPRTLDASAPPKTIDALLDKMPHFKVYGPTTIELEVGKVGNQGFGFNSTLVRFYVPVKPGLHRFFGNPFFLGFIPLGVDEGTPACGRLPKDFHYRFGPNQSGNAAGNLSGEYAPGWYHAVIVSSTESSYRVTFNDTSERKIKEAPGADPYVSAGYKRFTGKRAYEESFPMTDTWVAMAQFVLPGGNMDLGREMALSMTAGVECQAASSKQTQAENLASGAATIAQRRLTVGGYGVGADLRIQASYKPNSDSTATSDTTLEAVWVSVTTPKLPVAAEPPPPVG